MKIISFFNHKGGVSKTTSVYHLGWMLTKKGKKVLLVDTDSQCNLTLTVIGQDNYEEFVTNHPYNNIKSGLSAAFESKPELIKSVECVKVKDNEKLFLLPGSFEITEYEVQLGVSFQLTNTFSTLKNLPGAFYYLIRKTAEEIGADIVLIDLNPSLSAINQDLIISSDYFILPTSPDYFSEMAIKSIARILPNWEKWAKQSRDLFQEATYPLPMNTPKFLGYTVNDFTIRNQKPAKAFQEVIDKIDATVRNTLIPNLEKVNMLLPNEAYTNYRLAEIPNFQTLQAHFQENGMPVFELTDTMLGSSGAVLDDQKERKEKFGTKFSDFSIEILRLMDYAESH
ncbi:MAG: ParA family protein [Methylobacter sp.]|nr:ParA family protein [Methylobacter sp.]